ncbi:hypothetical protein L195_g018606 [Trifolium pratense]|uniref:Uncharacterized protein n=1 Tax=Trifolium pratense TaxID=57577 RepID=A0A2K3LUF6_TRIPR|nr:hypothetical protein L195_g038199 [Trifolium pratense]PNX95415.1 hypothetical protein L195_g018606 [Trifolium pratense]
MSNVTTDMIISHEETDDDTEETEYEKRNSEGDLLDGRFGCGREVGGSGEGFGWG